MGGQPVAGPSLWHTDSDCPLLTPSRRLRLAPPPRRSGRPPYPLAGGYCKATNPDAPTTCPALATYTSCASAACSWHGACAAVRGEACACSAREGPTPRPCRLGAGVTPLRLVRAPPHDRACPAPCYRPCPCRRPPSRPRAPRLSRLRRCVSVCVPLVCCRGPGAPCLGMPLPACTPAAQTLAIAAAAAAVAALRRAHFTAAPNLPRPPAPRCPSPPTWRS